MLALALSRHRFRGRRAMESLLYVPLVTPEIVVGISLLVLFAAIGVRLGIATIVVAHVAFSISFVTVVVRARLAGMDEHLEEAAMTLGAGPWRAFRRVTLPLIMPGVVAGALLAFTLSFDDYVITSFVRGLRLLDAAGGDLRDGPPQHRPDRQRGQHGGAPGDDIADLPLRPVRQVMSRES